MQTTLDYHDVGLMSGLEVHQQLLTREKLFCRCPAGLFVDTHDGEVLRHMRPTLSELGEYDGTALMEFKTKKEIVYLLNRLNVCTYEMDDTPPFLVNQQAIDIAIELSLMMHMDVIDEIHIARKQYLDGSIPTGFQRTAIIGVNGWLPFHGRRLNVSHLSVEEDSCREVRDKGHRIIFRTDRLGMPLTETVTAPELTTPQEVRDAIILCGLTARSTGHVRTGIGAARQDVNVSVRGGNRVEIKGVPRADYAVRLVHNEAIRQVNLLRMRDQMYERGMRKPTDVRMQTFDATEMLAGVELGFTCPEPRRIYAIKVEGVAGLAQHPTQPNHTFLSELAGRIRVIACLDDAPIVLCGSNLPDAAHVHRVRDKLRRRLSIGDQDEFFLVAGPQEDCLTAADEIRIRFADAVEGVPKETRQFLPGGYTTFERILPGPDRMYPDTDSPPTRVTPDRVERLRAGLPPAPWEREREFAQWGVPAETVQYLIRRGGAAKVEAVVRETGVAGRTAAVEIGQRGKALQRAGIPVDKLPAESWVGIFDLYAKGQIPREAIGVLATRLAQGANKDAQQAAADAGISLVQPEQWQAKLNPIPLEGYRGTASDPPAKRLRFVAGKAMNMLRGQAAARDVVAYLRDKLGETAQ